MKSLQKKFIRRFEYLNLLVLTLALSGAALSQEISNDLKDTKKLSKLCVTVADKDGNYIEAPEIKGFQVYAKGKELKILSAERKDKPMSIGILIDVSASMENKIEYVRYLDEFLKSSHTENEYFLTTFDNEITTQLDFTQDAEKLSETIRNISVITSKSLSKMYDAIDSGLDKLSKAKFDKRVLLLVGRGRDYVSKKDPVKVENKAGKSNVSIYWMAIGSDDRDMSLWEGRSLLMYISSKTGGNIYLPLTEPELKESFQKIATELRNQYEISFELDDKKYKEARNKGIKLKVEINPADYKTDKGKQKPIKLYARIREKIFLNS